MSTRFQASDPNALPPITREELEPYFHRAARPRDQWKVGFEIERLAVSRKTGHQLPFDGPQGIEAMLEAVASRYGWNRFYEGDRLIALLRDGASITLEPGGQVELSSAPAVSALTLREDLARHKAEFDSVINPNEVTWLGVGLSPYTRVDDVILIPKGRYGIMDAYLPPRGSHARYMMRATCSVQAAFDFSDEADAARKFLVTLSLAPIVNALFGNSAVYDGKLTGVVSYRGTVWEHMDPARSGLLGQWVHWEDFSFKTWVEYLLDRPMMFYCIADHTGKDQFIPAEGRTFRDYMAHGYDGHFPNMDDWDMHLTSVFPDARLKKYLEVRGADCVPQALVPALPALWKGLFYDPQALDAAEILGRQVGSMERVELFRVAYKQGLAGMWKGRSLLERARELVELSAQGLKRQAQEGRQADESILLDPLFEVLERGMSPGAQLIQAWPEIGHDLQKSIDAMAF